MMRNFIFGIGTIAMMCHGFYVVGLQEGKKSVEHIEEYSMPPAVGVVGETKDYWIVEESFHTYHNYKESHRVFHPHNCKCMKKNKKN